MHHTDNRLMHHTDNSPDHTFGTVLPRQVTEVPGPASRRLAERLAVVESPNITSIEGTPPIFWAAARGANVRDVDGNTFVDLTAGFGVAASGHANPRVAEAVGRQAATLAHGLGDVYPPEIKVRLLERLAELAPGELGVSILASAGAEAVEAALKTAIVYTGRPGVIAFTDSYHGLTYGALATTWRSDFREPFRPQLFGGVHFAPYPHPYHHRGSDDPVDSALAAIRRIVAEASTTAAPIGSVLVEPIQGRGGIVVPPPDFLPRLRQLCDELELVLIFDEVYTGFGRTGRWFAAEHWGVTPDLMAVGKALTGMLPLSAAIGTPAVMAGWPPSAGEAIHTSTFLGNPIACAAALAQIDEIETEGLVERAERVGSRLRDRLEAWRDRYPIVGDIRGLGLLQGVELVEDRETRSPATTAAGRVVGAALRRGVILLSEGPRANILALVPPLTITDEQLDYAVQVLEEEVARVAGAT
jgi:4-aminobutyrate aminotransferase